MICTKTGLDCLNAGCGNGICTLGFAPTQGFQLCPKCNGDGNLARYNPPNYYCEVPICDVCNGKKIISMQTGLPPT